MSPEPISCNRYDEKSDICALGCVIYEMAVLQPPFNNILRSEDELKRNRVHQVPKKLPQLYSEALASCVFAMLEKDPARRPSAEDILKVRNVNLTLKLEAAREELTAVRAALKDQAATLLTRAELHVWKEGRDPEKTAQTLCKPFPCAECRPSLLLHQRNREHEK
jgi:serine/threonine protein kinase